MVGDVQLILRGLSAPVDGQIRWCSHVEQRQRFEGATPGDRTRGFYGSVFDTGLQPMEGYDYTLALTTPVDDKPRRRRSRARSTVASGLAPRKRPPPRIVNSVDSIDESLKKIEAEGGTTLTPRAEMPGMRAYAYFKDAEGNVIGLWETL